jgi:predicted esterase
MDELRIDPDVALWSAPASDRPDRPLLVLLHGYGADEKDLSPSRLSCPPTSCAPRFGHR